MIINIKSPPNLTISMVGTKRQVWEDDHVFLQLSQLGLQMSGLQMWGAVENSIFYSWKNGGAMGSQGAANWGLPHDPLSLYGSTIPTCSSDHQFSAENYPERSWMNCVFFEAKRTVSNSIMVYMVECKPQMQGVATCSTYGWLLVAFSAGCAIDTPEGDEVWKPKTISPSSCNHG